MNFKSKVLALTHTFGSKAEVEFYDGGEVTYDSESNPTNAPTTANFTIPTSSAITSIENNDSKDRYIIAHIEPKADYWTDESQLKAYETTAIPLTSVGARKRTDSSTDLASFNALTLLKADLSDPTDATSTPRCDGAAWYYYILPKEHTFDTEYTTSTIDGIMIKKFNFSDVDPNATIAQDFDKKTITLGRTTDDWTATLNYDKFQLPFDGSFSSMPQVKSINIKKGSTEILTLTDANKIAAQINHNYNAGMPCIGNNDLQPGASTLYGWFKGTDDRSTGQTYFIIDVPFTTSTTPTTEKPAGSSTNPWLIRDAAELNLFAKCVNVGRYNFDDEYLEQTASITATADFEPIGMTGNLPFGGTFDGKGFTISGINYTYNPGMVVGDTGGPKTCIGLFGQVGYYAEELAYMKTGAVKNVKLSNCSFASSYDNDICYVGSIAGNVDNGTVSDCSITVANEGSSSVSTTKEGSYVGALFGKINSPNATLSNNFYAYDVTVTNSSGSASGYTKRGYWNSTKWDDITTNDGAMLYVKRATIENGTTGNGSAVTFNKTITPENATTETPANCYSIDNSTTPVTYWYAPGQEITLNVTEGTITDGSRTLKEELTALTMSYDTGNGTTTSTDIKTSKSFTMPDAAATVTPTFTASEWFTVPSNQKKWMTFYHDWKDNKNAAANYTVTDDTGAKTINVWTITAIDAATGGITKKDLGGVSFSGVPTLFNSDNNLPAVLKFTPATDVTAPTDVATQFKGVAAATALSGDNIYVMNGDGGFDHAYLPASVTNTLNANRCYIDLGTNSGARRLFFIEEAVTSIGEVTGVTEVTEVADDWFTLDGRKLDKLPTKKGLYIYKGKLTVIK
ncbi:MAG: hypothetical protein K6G32_10870 [Prevotella sp.]|nr:hypothetical protein [Prevotella sp.]